MDIYGSEWEMKIIQYKSLIVIGYKVVNQATCLIKKEKDRESKLGDHGVRKYDYEIGRFTSVDPLWETYTGWTGYQYSLNNPVKIVKV